MLEVILKAAVLDRQAEALSDGAMAMADIDSSIGSHIVFHTQSLVKPKRQISQAEAAQALSDDAAAMVEEAGGNLYGKTHNSVLNADSSDPLSVSMTGIDTEMRR